MILNLLVSITTIFFLSCKRSVDPVIPDETNYKIAFISDRTGNENLFIMDSDGQNQLSLTNDQYIQSNPQFSPDGSKILFVSYDFWNSLYSIFIVNIDGTGLVQLTDWQLPKIRPDWSPDGTKIIFELWLNQDVDIYSIELNTLNKVNLTNTIDDSERSPKFSPDGTQIVYIREADVFIMNTDGSSQQNITNSPRYEFFPMFSPDGQSIFFIVSAPNNFLYSVDLDGNNERLHIEGFYGTPGVYFSQDGSKILYEDNVSGSKHVCIYDINTTEIDVITEGYEPHWSGDNSKIVYTLVRELPQHYTKDVCIMNKDGSNVVNLTDTTYYDNFEAKYQP